MVVRNGRQARHEAHSGDPDKTRTRVLGALVAVMVVAGVVALLMTIFGNNSDDSQAASQPSGSQVGKQTSSAATASASTTAPATSVAPTTSTPTSAPTTPARSTPAPRATSKPPARTSASASAATKVVKYTVRKGDNLTLIAGWFNQRGYGLVYDWNKSVIGQNPNLIYPGQTIIVSLTGDHMKVTTKNK